MLSARDGSKAKGDEADTWGGARSKTGPDSAIKAGHNAGVGVSTSTPAVGAEETSNSLSHAEAASRSVPNKLVPHQLEQHLQSLDFSPEGHLLLACCNLTGTYWTGSLWYYDEPSAAPNIEGCVTGCEVDNGVHEAIFFGKERKQILVGLDNGAVSCFKLSVGTEDAVTKGHKFSYLEQTQCVHEHKDVISGMTVSCDERHIITGSYDKSIVVLDVASYLAKTREWIFAHDDVITSIDACKRDPNIFFSASQDGKVALWDLREEKCQKVVFDDAKLPPSCIQTVPNEDNFILIGNSAGHLSLYDLRNLGAEVALDFSTFSDQIVKARFSTKRTQYVAVAAESCIVGVYQVDVHSKEPLVVRYKDEERHTDYVRGLAWHPTDDSLWSCGWDKAVLSHKLFG